MSVSKFSSVASLYSFAPFTPAYSKALAVVLIMWGIRNSIIAAMILFIARLVFFFTSSSEPDITFLKKSNVYMSIGKPYKISTLSEKDREDLGEYNRSIVKSLIINVNNPFWAFKFGLELYSGR